MVVPIDSQTAALSRVPAQIPDLADIDSQDAISSIDTLGNLVLDPSALVRIRTNQHDRDCRAFELLVNPCFDGIVALTLNLFEVSLIDKPRLDCARDDIAITNIHRTLDVVILEAEEDFSCHFLSLDDFQKFQHNFRGGV